jgi:cytochrome c oxidase subunit 2
MIIVLVLILITVGSVVFHVLSPWWSTPIASNWGSIDATIDITFWITGVVFVAVLFFMTYCLWRFRYQEGRRAEYDPENTKLEWLLTGGTAIGVAALLIPGLFVWSQYVTVPEDAADIEVVGQQWMWSFRTPGADGVLGLSDTRRIDFDNPFGLDPDDPNGQDDVLIDAGEDLHLPLGKPVRMLLRSIDVLHDFYVPQFRAKMDLVPGMITYFWLTPTRTGTFDILCAELCGVGHHEMRGLVVVEEDSAYQAWLAEQQTFAQAMAEARNDDAGTVKLARGGNGAGASHLHAETSQFHVHE